MWFQCFGRKVSPLLDWQEVLARQTQYPTTSTKAILPFSDQCSRMSPQLLCCATLPSVSCMPMKLTHVCDYQKNRASDLIFTQQSRRRGLFRLSSFVVGSHVISVFHEKSSLSVNNSLFSLSSHSTLMLLIHAVCILNLLYRSVSQMPNWLFVQLFF